MSHEELALETELLLQGVSDITRHTTVEIVLENAKEVPLSEYEVAKDALLAKLRKKKEVNRVQHQELHRRRYNPVAAQKNDSVLSCKTRTQMQQLPVAIVATASSRKKQDMLLKLKTRAIQQGAENMAKLFGYASYEEHVKHLNKLEEVKMAESEIPKKTEEEKEEVEEEVTIASVDMSADVAAQEVDNDVCERVAKVVVVSTDVATDKKIESKEQESAMTVRHCNRDLKPCSVDQEEDGNEADSEQDKKDEDGADQDMEDGDDVVDVMNDARKQKTVEAGEGDAMKVMPTTPKDKAAGYRSLLRAEAIQSRKRKRLIKGRGDNFVELEAEEEEEEDVLKIGGLGDFGFGVPQAMTQESKEAEEERNALKLREDDLDHIVDDLSDDERAQELDLEKMFRREQENQDRQQVKEVMRNVKEGFGRNRRAFSGLYSASGARGRFNLDELVAADGSKFEAARLGLLESDAELSDDDNDGKRKRIKKAGGDDEEEEDEEAEMERLLRQRFLNQPKMYLTSSESGSDDEEEEVEKDNGSDGNEFESDEERERQQMKLFSERARINRRMQRMKDMQRQIALTNNEADAAVTKNVAMPNVLLEEDEDSQELMHLLNRTDVDSARCSQSTTGSSAQKKSDWPQSKPGQYNPYGGITCTSRTSSSSFSRVIGQCKMFSVNSTGGGTSSKGFVFTSFSADRSEKEDDENAAVNHDEIMPGFAVSPDLDKRKKSSSHVKTSEVKYRDNSNAATTMESLKFKKRKSGGLFSVLSSYQCVSRTSSHESEVDS